METGLSCAAEASAAELRVGTHVRRPSFQKEEVSAIHTPSRAPSHASHIAAVTAQSDASWTERPPNNSVFCPSSKRTLSWTIDDGGTCVCVRRKTWSRLFSAAAPNRLEPYLGQRSCLHSWSRPGGTRLEEPVWGNPSGDHLLPPMDSLLSSSSLDFTWNLGALRPTSSGEKQRH